MARIVINHLASIHHIEVEIKQMNMLIGEQATGKSTLCKAVFYFRNFKELLIDYFYTVAQNEEEQNVIKEVSRRLKNSFISLFGYSWQLPDDLSMVYYYTENHYITIELVKKNRKYISVKYSNELKKALKNIQKKAKEHFESVVVLRDDTMLPILENRMFYKQLQSDISKLLDDDMTTYYIPAGRGLLSLLCNQKTYLNYGELEPLNRKFMQTIETLQPKFADGISSVHNFFQKNERKFDVESMCRQIIHGMKGEYFYQKGREFLQIENSNERVAINFASSGQQEALWLYNQLYVLMLKDEKSFIIIEEPEAHLYPILQKNILDFIVTYLNITNSSAIVTTHSPYLLTEANNLYIIGRMKESGKRSKEIEKIAGKWNYISGNDFNAYKMSNGENGTEIESLFDGGHQEIMASKIDEISSEIDEVYTQLYYLEEE